MRPFAILFVSVTFLLVACSQSPPKAESGMAMGMLSNASVEVGCGQCIYGMAGVEGCEAAAMVDGKPMLIKGVEVDAHGQGLCSAAKEAVVSGKIEGDTLVATSVELESP